MDITSRFPKRWCQIYICEFVFDIKCDLPTYSSCLLCRLVKNDIKGGYIFYFRKSLDSRAYLFAYIF